MSSFGLDNYQVNTVFPEPNGDWTFALVQSCPHPVKNLPFRAAWVCQRADCRSRVDFRKSGRSEPLLLWKSGPPGPRLVST